MEKIFSDFDGTLTYNGKLSAEFFELLNLIDQNNSELIIVSGRSLSWGHFLLTHFPVKSVIMEGGGVIITKDVDGTIKEEVLVYDEDLSLLEEATRFIKENIPGVVFSADSFGRKTDRAIEFSQTSDDDLEKLENYLLDNDLYYSKSNVHINFWAGEVSKAFGVKYFLNNYMPHVNELDCIFYGDAMNDESMFEYFSNSVGVSNIISIIDRLKHKPKIVLKGKENIGIYGVLAHLKEIFNQSIDF